MNAIMMYMSGNSLQIFSIMMTAMLFMNPLKALSSVASTFSRFDNERTHSRLWPVKLAFIALQLATIALGIWKVNGMGLLPCVTPVCADCAVLTICNVQDHALGLAGVGERTATVGIFGPSLLSLIGREMMLPGGLDRGIFFLIPLYLFHTSRIFLGDIENTRSLCSLLASAII